MTIVHMYLRNFTNFNSILFYNNTSAKYQTACWHSCLLLMADNGASGDCLSGLQAVTTVVEMPF